MQSVPSWTQSALLHAESQMPSEIQLGGQPGAQSLAPQIVAWHHSNANMWMLLDCIWRRLLTPLRQEVTESHTVVRAALTSEQVLKVPSSAEVSIVHVRP